MLFPPELGFAFHRCSDGSGAWWGSWILSKACGNTARPWRSLENSELGLFSLENGITKNGLDL